MERKLQMSNVHHMELPKLRENALLSSSDGRHQSAHAALQQQHCEKVYFTNIQDYPQPQPPLKLAKHPKSCFCMLAQAPHVAISKTFLLPFTIFLNRTGPSVLRLWIITHPYKAKCSN